MSGRVGTDSRLASRESSEGMASGPARMKFLATPLMKEEKEGLLEKARVRLCLQDEASRKSVAAERMTMSNTLEDLGYNTRITGKKSRMQHRT